MPRIAPNRDLILAYVKGHPWTDSRAIANALNMIENSVSGSLNHLYTARLVDRERRGRPYVYTARSEPKVVSVSEVDRLKAELEREKAWRAEAEAKHPDLKTFDYEAYRPALRAYYAAVGVSVPHLVGDTPMDSLDITRVKGLIAAMPLMPQGDEA